MECVHDMDTVGKKSLSTHIDKSGIDVVRMLSLQKDTIIVGCECVMKIMSPYSNIQLYVHAAHSVSQISIIFAVAARV